MRTSDRADRAPHVVGLLALVLGACASLTPEGARVVLATDRGALRGCTFLGDVAIRPSPGSASDDLIRLQNLAGPIGANALWIDSSVVAPGGRLYASAFACRR